MVRQLVIIVLTGLALAIAWAAWTYAPMLVRKTPWQDYRHIVQLCAVFIALSVCHAVVKRIPVKLD